MDQHQLMASLNVSLEKLMYLLKSLYSCMNMKRKEIGSNLFDEKIIKLQGNNMECDGNVNYN